MTAHQATPPSIRQRAAAVQAVIDKILLAPDTFPTSVDPTVARYLYRLVREQKSSLIFEMGCYTGHTTLSIGKALQENGNGRLIAFDFDITTVCEYVREAGLCDCVELIQGDSATNARSFLTEEPEHTLDLVFIDGDHTRRGCVRDFGAVHDSVREGGYIVFHDTIPSTCGWRGPRFVLDCLEEQGASSPPAQYELEDVPSLDPFGVTVCRKISSGENPVGKRSLWAHPLFWLSTSKPAAFIELMQFYGRFTHNPVRLFYRFSKLMISLVKKRIKSVVH